MLVGRNMHPIRSRSLLLLLAALLSIFLLPGYVLGEGIVANFDQVRVVAGGAPVEIDVLANDTDADGDLDPTTVTTNPVLPVDPVTGVVTYTPPAVGGFDFFTYEVCDGLVNDGESTCSQGFVSITVSGPPVAEDDELIVPAESPLAVWVLLSYSLFRTVGKCFDWNS